MPPHNQKKLLYMDWNSFNRLISKLEAQLQEGYHFDVIVGVSKGGLVPAVMIADYFQKPLIVASAEHYQRGFMEAHDSSVKLLSMPKFEANTRYLIVDDVIETGATLMDIFDFINNSVSGCSINSAVLVRKNPEQFYKNMRIISATTREWEDWIVFPWQAKEFKELLEAQSNLY